MKISDITQQLERLAPLSLQENYDNAGLITGQGNVEATGVLICLDSTEEVIEEAIRKKCNLVIAHHPIIFSGLKKLNGKNYVERTIIRAIKNDIAIYAIHTNLDNVYRGVNEEICNRLQLINCSVLSPMPFTLRKLITFVPAENAEGVLEALFDAGAGSIGRYTECSFSLTGSGTFKAMPGANPTVGKVGMRENQEEKRLEVLYEKHLETGIIKSLKEAHPYEEVAYDCYELQNLHQEKGAGMIGELKNKMNTNDFLDYLKATMLTNCIRHTKVVKPEVKKIGVCGGSGSFLLSKAIASGADVFITADYKYHQFFDADGKIMIADIGHYESEQFTAHVISRFLKDNFPTFAVHLSEINTNPVNYF